MKANCFGTASRMRHFHFLRGAAAAVLLPALSFCGALTVSGGAPDPALAEQNGEKPSEPPPENKTPEPQKDKNANPKKTDESKEPLKPQPLDLDLDLDDNAYRSMLTFLHALAIIKTHYVDSEKASYERLFEAALSGMMQELDPFSSYIPPGNATQFNEDMEGNFAGIGIVLSGKNRILEIISVLPDSPAAKAGLRPGDVILEIDGKPLKDADFEQISKMIRGPVGSTLSMKIYRGTDDSTRDIKMTREIVVVSTVTGTKIIEDNGAKTGYLRLTQFGAQSAVDMQKAIAELEKQGMSALIVDLRDNPGGLLDVAISICSMFIKTGELVVSIEGRGDNKTYHKAIGTKKYENLPLLLLVNGNSASAAELFSACMQDYKRAIVVGEKTFGKGSVQQISPFENKGALRITIAKYYTPAHRVIHGVGIEPDILVPLSNGHRFLLSNQLTLHPGEVKPAGIPNAVRDIQLERALELLKGIQIYQSLMKNAPAAGAASAKP